MNNDNTIIYESYIEDYDITPPPYLIVQHIVNEKSIVSIHNKKPVDNTLPRVKVNYFFLITYKDKYNNSIDITDKIKDFLIEGNEILSIIFIAKYLKNNHPNIKFDPHYTLNILDTNFKNLQLDSTQYIHLLKDSYSVETLKN
jgi:hypothetical protein